jgi:hypothetical protein
MTKLSTPISFFKKESKKLLRQAKANDAEALARIRRVLKDTVDASLMRIQYVIATEYGFSKWNELINSPATELKEALARKKIFIKHSEEPTKKIGTPLGNLFRGPEIIPTPPHFAVLAELFNNMTPQGQERCLDEAARVTGLFDR